MKRQPVDTTCGNHTDVIRVGRMAETKTAPAVGADTPSEGLATATFGDTVTEQHPTRTQETELRRTTFQLAKFLDATVTKSDPLLVSLEDAFRSGSPTRMSDAALDVLYRAEAVTWGGGA